MNRFCKNKILSQSVNGKIIKCLTCNQYHIEFLSLNFTFDDEEFKFFKDYILSLDGAYWENQNRHSIYRRKVIVPIGLHNVHAMFTAQEIREFKNLLLSLSKKPNHCFIGLETITSELIMN